MKLNVNKFRGLIGLNYRIEAETKECLVSLSLLIKLPNANDYTFFDCVTGSFNNDEESSKVGLMKAIESAHTKWGINLIKEPFTINSMISVNQDTIKNNLN